MIDVAISSPEKGLRARILTDGLGPGLLTYAAPAHEYESAFKPFLNDDNGANMNVNAAAGGTPIDIHNGIDNAYYTGTDIIGTIEFDSTFRPQAGTKSIRWNGEAVGTISQFAGASIDGSAYVSTTFGINVNRRWEAGDVIMLYAWDTSGAVQVGDAVSIGDYFDYTNNDVWQQVSIPLSDMTLDTSTFDAFRTEVVSIQATAPDFFIDDWKVQETGTPVTYEIDLAPDEVFLADQLLGVASNAVAAAVAPGTLFGLTLTTGINYVRKRGNATAFSANITSMTDLLQNRFTPDAVMGAASDTVWSMRARFGQPLLFDPRTDYARMTLTEDFSALSSLRVSMIGRTEKLTNLSTFIE